MGTRGAVVLALLAGCESGNSASVADGPAAMTDAGRDAAQSIDAAPDASPDPCDVCFNPAEPSQRIPCGGRGQPLQCPPQRTTSHYCVSGVATRFVDDGLPIDSRRMLRDVCARAFSPTDFIAGNVQPLGTPAEARMDCLGRFLIQDIPETSTKFIVVGIDDCGEPPSRTLTGSYATTFAGGEQVSGQSTIDLASGQTTAVAITTEEARALVAQAGRDVYGVGGSYIMIFRDPRTSSYPPVQGVIPYGVSDDFIDGTDAIYFGADLSTLDPTRPFSAGTGPTGAVLINPPHVTQYSGRGDPGAIPWDTILGGAADGSFFVQRWRLKRQ